MKYPEGSVHGRFQPLHNGHLKYILGAKAQCDFLWVGVTQFNVRHLVESPLATHRHEDMNNPLTYNERLEMIKGTLIDHGITSRQFDVIPFPIEIPDCLADFLPKRVPIFTTVCEEWNRYKVEILKKAGYKVVVLWEDSVKEIDGMTIRRMIFENDERWKRLVPSSTVKIVEKYGIRERIKLLKEKSNQ